MGFGEGDVDGGAGVGAVAGVITTIVVYFALDSLSNFPVVDEIPFADCHASTAALVS
jgi:hypothetical protein